MTLQHISYLLFWHFFCFRIIFFILFLFFFYSNQSVLNDATIAGFCFYFVLPLSSSLSPTLQIIQSLSLSYQNDVFTLLCMHVINCTTSKLFSLSIHYSCAALDEAMATICCKICTSLLGSQKNKRMKMRWCKIEMKKGLFEAFKVQSAWCCIQRSTLSRSVGLHPSLFSPLYSSSSFIIYFSLHFFLFFFFAFAFFLPYFSVHLSSGTNRLVASSSLFISFFYSFPWHSSSSSSSSSLSLDKFTNLPSNRSVCIFAANL